jgi:coenzyme PQQ precursor peptide PqqA
MKTWFKPEITETEAGMEVTSYLPAELTALIDVAFLKRWRPRMSGVAFFYAVARRRTWCRDPAAKTRHPKARPAPGPPRLHAKCSTQLLRVKKEF